MEAISKIAEQLSKVCGEKAAAAWAKEYVNMYGEMGSKSNTKFFQERPGDVKSLVLQACAGHGCYEGDERSRCGTKLRNF